jgi:hypothetical protein
VGFEFGPTSEPLLSRDNKLRIVQGHFLPQNGIVDIGPEKMLAS